MAVAPLVWMAEPTLTEAPVVVNVAIKAVTSVPKGTVKATVFADSLIVPVTAGLIKLKAVKALEEMLWAWIFNVIVKVS